MCGITGAVPGISPELLRSMTKRLAHRGPDGDGFVCAPQVSLGHRRLAVIDLASGAQPMSTPDGRFTVTFNGEIYNYREVRAELERDGDAPRFATQSDTEVLLQAFARWGIAALDRLRGMFAFALWDAHEQSLWLVRDRLGVKPLYYARLGQQLLFASEIKALLAHPRVSRRLNSRAVDDFLTYLYIPAPQTAFESVHELPPAHWLRWQNGQTRIERYWDALPQAAGSARNGADSALEVREQLRQAVQLRMVSDVPVGAFLSGGMDSSSIVAFMAEASATPVRSFSLGFGAGEERYTELDYARLVANHFGAEHRELTIRASCADLLPTLVEHFDEPFGNPTALLLYQLSQKTREHVTVALAGDGGDEAFLGYPRHMGAALQSRMGLLPRPLRALLAKCADWIDEDASGAHTRRRLREFLSSAAEPWQSAYAGWVTYFAAAQRADLYTPEFRSSVGDYRAESFIEGWFARAAGAHPLDQAGYVDLHTFLPHNLLEYGDRMSMAHGLEVRLPFTDHKLVELALRLPPRLKLKGRTTKYVLREAMRPLLPAAVLQRSKLGLNPPLGIWLRGELALLIESRLSPAAVRRAGWFRPEAVARIVADFRAGRRDYALHIWALLVLDQWRRQILEGEGSALDPAAILGATA